MTKLLVPPRMLRTFARSITGVTRENQPERIRKREALILAVCIPLIARYGREKLSFTALAHALDLSHNTLRRHFSDLHEMIGEILRAHYAAILAAIDAVPLDTPDLHAARARAAYRATHDEHGNETETQKIAVQEWARLAPDMQAILNPLRDEIAAKLAAPGAESDTFLVFGYIESPCPCENTLAEMLAPRTKPYSSRPQPHSPARPGVTTAPEPQPQPEPERRKAA